MRTMYDSTTASDIPADAEMVAGYVDGAYRWTDADWARFPNAIKVRIAVFATTDEGHVGDVENGCMTPQEAREWVKMRRASGSDPTLYVNPSNHWTVRDLFIGVGLVEPHYWLAHYDNVPDLQPDIIAKQYAHEPLTGGHFDASVVADFWPGVDEMTDDELIAAFDRIADRTNTVRAIKERLAIDAHHTHQTKEPA